MSRALALGLGYACEASAQPPSDALVGARVCFGEARFRRNDCSAILHALQRRARRAGMTFADSPRARWVRAMPDGDVPGQGRAWNRRWARLRHHARAVLAGRVADNCGADHWGSRTLEPDVRRARRAVEAGRWVHARCADTVNAFYVTVRR